MPGDYSPPDVLESGSLSAVTALRDRLLSARSGLRSGK